MLDKHFLLQLVSTAGMIPLAAANAPALIKFRKCVTGDKIVFAICDVALGYKNKFSYTRINALEFLLLAFVFSNASATPFFANLPLIGLVEPASNCFAGSIFIFLKSSPNSLIASS